MKGFGRAKDDEQAGEIDLTPMLDVVFILLIFFIVTAVFVKEAGYEVERPVAATTSQIDVEPILIAISPAGDIFIDGDQIPPRTVRIRIEQRLAETPNAGVVIQADQAAANENVLLVMDAARQSQAPSIHIAAEE